MANLGGGRVVYSIYAYDDAEAEGHSGEGAAEAKVRGLAKVHGLPAKVG